MDLNIVAVQNVALIYVSRLLCRFLKQIIIIIIIKRQFIRRRNMSVDITRAPYRQMATSFATAQLNVSDYYVSVIWAALCILPSICLPIVRPNLLSVPDVLGNCADGCMWCRHSAPTYLPLDVKFCNESVGLRFCNEADPGNPPVVSSSVHSKLIGLFHRSTGQRIRSSDKTSLPQRNPVDGKHSCTGHPELSSKKLPFEVCYVDFLEICIRNTGVFLSCQLSCLHVIYLMQFCVRQHML